MTRLAIENTGDGGLEKVLANKTVASIVGAIRRNACLAEVIFDQQSTTQHFSCAEDLGAAFKGELNEVVDVQFPGISQESRLLMEQYGVSDEDVVGVLKKVWIYSRLTNPVAELLEEVIALMDGAEKSAVFASGLGAMDAAVRQFTSGGALNENGEYLKGDKIVVVGSIYGGTYAQLMNLCKETGRQFAHLPISEFVKKGLPDDAGMVLFETSNNPTLRMVPIPKIVEEAKRVGAVTVCDNTFTPLIVRPAELGIDLAVTSMTKYFNGQSGDLGGCISGNADLISQLSDLHSGRRMLGGAIMAPRVCKEFLNNLKDLPERLFKASENAKGVHNVAGRWGFEVEAPNDFEYYNDVRTEKIPDQLVNGMVALHFSSAEEAHKFVNQMVKEGMGYCAVSLGSVDTYYSIPAETTHSEMPEDERERIGIGPGLVRISCGVEADLIKVVEKVLSRM